MNVGQHVPEQPAAVHFDKCLVARPLLQGVQQRLVDVDFVERVDLVGRKQCVVMHQTITVGLVETVRGLQAGGKLAWLFVGPKTHLDHVEIAMLRVLPLTHFNDLADGKLQRREDQRLADLVTLLRYVDRAFGEVLLDARIFAAQMLVNESDGEVA